MHCHLVVSRKDQSNKIKISPLTNHRNTKKGTVKGGFDRKNLFQQAEQGFDKLFDYKRELTETFEYCNTMKNGNISDQLDMQEKQIADERKNTNMQISNDADKVENKFADFQENNHSNNIENKQSFNIPDLGLSSALGLLTPDVNNQEEEQSPMKRKKKKPKKGIRR
jgi:hypothetical protein